MTRQCQDTGPQLIHIPFEMPGNEPEVGTWVNCGAELAAAAASYPDASGQLDGSFTQQVTISTRGHLRAVPQSR